MHAGTVNDNITQYIGVRKLETVTVAELVRKPNKKGPKSLVSFMEHCHETTLSLL
ncbi:hypothetical protein HID58_061373, partial [Brassica napus]